MASFLPYLPHGKSAPKTGGGGEVSQPISEKHCKEELRDGPSEEGQGGEDSTPRGGPRSRSLGCFFGGESAIMSFR